MRLWTLHPKYLDAHGLVALWREALLAKAVLRGETKGYRYHPQLIRFREHSAPRGAINFYLSSVLADAVRRGYSFDSTKVGPVRGHNSITATSGQLEYEWDHLLGKLRSRSPAVYRERRAVTNPIPHPLFLLKTGPVEEWERGVMRA